MNLPLKQRCGVTDPTNPGKRNLCTCSESADNAAGISFNIFFLPKKIPFDVLDFGIWSVVEITSSTWSTSLGFPSSSDFLDLELEFEKQVK